MPRPDTDPDDEGSTALLHDLRSAIGAPRVLTTGPDFARSATLFNAAVDIRPAVIVRCATTADVQTAIRAAREHDMPVSVRGGGHDAWGRALRPGGLAIDLSDLHTVRVDADQRVATVGGGALSSDVVTAAEEVGLTAVTGTAGSVGMIGVTLGGGYGPLTGRYGLASDNLVGAEVVLADGSRVETDAEREPDLFWALRGGGGNFGVVTSARIRLHPVPNVVTGTILYPLDRARQVLADLDELLQGGPDELTVDVGLLPGKGGPTVYVAPTWAGDLDTGDADNGPVRALTRLGTPLVADLEHRPRSALLAASDAMFPPGRMGAIRTRDIPRLSEPIVDILIPGAEEFTSPFSAILLHQFHGAATRLPLDSTAFGRRDPHQMTELIALWDADRADGAAHLHWLEDMHAALEPFALPGGYPNFLGPETPTQVAHSYGPNAQRLLAVKSRVDPDEVFVGTPLPRSAPE